MRAMVRLSAEALVALATLSLAACGGGGSGSSGDSNGGSPAPAPTPAPAPPPSPTAEGLYIGTSSNGRTVTGIVLDTGTYWVIYSRPNNPAIIAGAIEGTSTSREGSFVSGDARDFNLEGLGINDATISASYVAKQSFKGNVTYTAALQNIAFTASYSPDFDIVPSLATVAGSYSGTAAVVAGVEPATVTIDGNGALSGQGSSGCRFSGSVAPHTRGNVYDVSVTFGGGVCANGTSSVAGIGYFDAGSKRLYGTALNADRTNGFIFVGTKP